MMTFTEADGLKAQYGPGKRRVTPPRRKPAAEDRMPPEPDLLDDIHLGPGERNGEERGEGKGLGGAQQWFHGGDFCRTGRDVKREVGPVSDLESPGCESVAEGPR